MNIGWTTAIAVLAACSQCAWADTHCYTFRNDSPGVTTLTFSYNQTVGNVITSAAIDPGRTFPFDGHPWCWNLPDAISATVAVSGTGAPGWKGELVLGNGTTAAPTGTYAVVGVPPISAKPAPAPAPNVPPAVIAPAAVAAPPASTGSETCITNAYPNNAVYCLTSNQTGIRLGCGMGHTGISGSIVISRLALTCKDGRKFKLTCTPGLHGTQLCNVDESEMCTGSNPWNAGDYCTH